jgi:metal-responsive CopG/Arc/MetJ family transcriptional regulator
MTGEYEGQPFMDLDGNSNIPLSKKFALGERKKVSDNASDRTAIDRYIAEKPFTPAEATLNIKGNIFPKADLIRHLANIRNSKKMSEFKQVGILVSDKDGTLKWEISTKLKDLNKYRVELDQDKSGAVVIWEHPVTDPPYGLYIAGCDPYDHDHSTTNSLGSCIIYKRFQNFESYYDLPVAEYTGRPDSAEEFYEIVRRLIKYYNAKLLYENEKKGLYVYFTQHHEEYLLADQPDIINDIMQTTTKVSRKKGIHMNKEIKLWGERVIRDWLNEEYAPGYKNLSKIFSEALLEELISYNEDGNFDRVMAFMMIMIYKEELHHVHVQSKKDYEKSRWLFSEPLFKGLEKIGWI